MMNTSHWVRYMGPGWPFYPINKVKLVGSDLSSTAHFLVLGPPLSQLQRFLLTIRTVTICFMVAFIMSPLFFPTT